MDLSKPIFKVLFVVVIILMLPFAPVGADFASLDPNLNVKKDLDSFPNVRSDVLKKQSKEIDERWWTQTTMDEDKDGVFDNLETWLETGNPAAIFVDYDHTPGPEDVARLEDLGLETSRIYEFVDAIGVYRATGSQVKEISEQPDVIMIEPSGRPVAYMDVSTANAKARESVEYSPHSAWENGFSGVNNIIAIMDTGIDNGHPALNGKWVGGADVSKPETPFWTRDGTFDADDTNGHGTTCAGIATSTGAPDGVYMGPAYDSKLVDLRIGTIFGFSPGEGPQDFYDGTIQGTEWAIQFADHEWPGQGPEYQGIDILSLSWGNNVGGSSDGKDVYSRGIDKLAATGIIPIIAAGNAGPDNDGFDGLGAADMAITIAASDDGNTIVRDDDIIASYSSRGPRKDDGDDNPYEEMKPDVTASGTHIDGVEYDRIGDGSGNGYGSRGSGTSYATPLVAGVVSLMLDANENLTLDLVREILHFTSERRGTPMYPELDPFWNKDFGWGLIDAYNATRVAANTTPIEDYDTNLQAFIMNVSTNRYNDRVVVEGIAWHKMGIVEKVEVNIDGKGWKKAKDMANDTWAKWTFKIPKSQLKKGNHTVRARAVADDKHSLEHERMFKIDDKHGGILGANNGFLLWVILALSAVATGFVALRRIRRTMKEVRRTGRALRRSAMLARFLKPR